MTRITKILFLGSIAVASLLGIAFFLFGGGPKHRRDPAHIASGTAPENPARNLSIASSEHVEKSNEFHGIVTDSEEKAATAAGSFLRILCRNHDGGFVQDADLKVFFEGLSAERLVCARGKTNLSGSATLEVPAGGPYNIIAAFGSQSAQVYAVYTTKSEITDVDVLFLPIQKAVVECLDEGGVPVPKANVRIFEGGLELAGSYSDLERNSIGGVTNEDGEFTFESISDGYVGVTATAAGYFSQPTSAILTRGRACRIRMTMKPGVKFRVKAVSDSTGEAISGLRLWFGLYSADGSSRGERAFSVVSDTEGAIEFTKPHGVRVSCYARESLRWSGGALYQPDQNDNILRLIGDDPIRVRVLPGPGIDFIPSRLEVHYIHSWRSGPLKVIVESDSDGLFPIPFQGNRFASTCRLIAPGVGSSRDLRLQRSESGREQTVVLSSAIHLKGVVIDELTRAPIPSAKVGVYLTQGQIPTVRAGLSSYRVASAVTDERGEFSLEGVIGNSLELRVQTTLGGYAIHPLGAQPQEDSQGIVIEVGHAGNLEIAVKKDGAPMIGANCWINSSPGQREWRRLIRTDHLGIAALAFMPTGSFDLVVLPPSVVPPMHIIARPPFAQTLQISPHALTRITIDVPTR